MVFVGDISNSLMGTIHKLITGGHHLVYMICLLAHGHLHSLSTAGELLEAIQKFKQPTLQGTILGARGIAKLGEQNSNCTLLYP